MKRSISTIEWILVNVLIAFATILFVIGVWAPMLTLTKLVLISNTFSILSGIEALVQEEQMLLAVIIGTFSILFPCLKILLLLYVWNIDAHWRSQALHKLELFGKWSMLDVFVVAVLVASVKLGSLMSIDIHYGLYVFALAVILIMIATRLVVRRILTSPVTTR